MHQLRDLVITIGITAVVVGLLYGIFGVGGSLRPPASDPSPVTQVVYVPR
jgi:hypothetical protein